MNLSKATIASFVFAFFQSALAQTYVLETPQSSIYYPLAEGVRSYNAFTVADPQVLQLKTSLVEETIDIDFEKRRISFYKEDPMGIRIWEFHYDELDEYLQSRQRHVLKKLWFEQCASYSGGAAAADRSLRLEWSLSDQYWVKNPVAKRILGKEPPKLSITGFEEIEISYRTDDVVQQGVNSDRDNRANSLNFENRYNLTVNGSIGKLIRVNMHTSSEEEGVNFSDNLQDIKLEYRGEGNELEDEIIQEVVAGQTSFEIPGTRLSGYAEGHEGLFGISVKSKFGPLRLTSVLSHEEGKAKTATFYPNESKADQSDRSELAYKDHKIYFLDTLYQNNYYQVWQKPGSGNQPEIERDFQVWKMVRQVTNIKKTVKEDVGSIYRYVDNAAYANPFKLIPRDGYYVNWEEGWIRFDTVSVTADDVIGIYMSTANPALVPTRGDTTIIDSVDGLARMDSLWILKREDIQIDTASMEFRLMWRNVYDLPRSDEEDIEIEIERSYSDGNNNTKKSDDGTFFSQILGLTDANEKARSDNRIFDRENSLLIVPPYSDSTVYGTYPFTNPDLGQDNTHPQIYELKRNDREFTNLQPKYSIRIKGSYTQRQTKLSLGWGVIPNTEAVMLGSTKLKRNEDYTIFYEMGEIELISIRAREANKIEVTYQQESFFIPEKKVFMGLRGEVDLPGIGENSKIGTSVLWRLQTAKNEVPRVGQEAYSKLLLDVNSNFNFEPEWMTRAVNLLPGIKTDVDSRLNVEFEAAHSRMIDVHKDNDGEAFVDNFDAADRNYPIGTSHNAWHQASPPALFLKDTTLSNGIVAPKLLFHPPAWHQYWYQPISSDNEKDFINKEIFQNPYVNNGKDTLDKDRAREWATQEVPVLRLVTQPASDSSALTSRYRYPWAGITYYFPPSISSTDRTEDRFLEFYVNADINSVGNGKGKLYVDLGLISEDISIDGGPPNGMWDNEQQEASYTSEQNIGLDLREDENEFYVVPNASFTGWDTLFSASGANPDTYSVYFDPGRDNYSEYNRENLGNRIKVNGTQADPSGLTSEDINNDGFRKQNDYFSYEIDLAALNSSPYTDTLSNAIASAGWYKIRIPVGTEARPDTTIGNPQWENIQFLRFWWSDFQDNSSLDAQRELVFTQIQFVANQWEEVPTILANPDTLPVILDPGQATPGIPAEIKSGQEVISERIKIRPSTINSDENTEYYSVADNTPDIFKKYESGSDRFNREYTLVLDIEDLEYTEEASIRKLSPFREINLAAYETMSFLLLNKSMPNHDSLLFSFKFGTDDSTYYEYTRPINFGRSTFYTVGPIEFKKLAQIKNTLVNDPVDSVFNDTIPVTGKPGAFYVIRGRKEQPPNFSKIRMLKMGVVNRISAQTISGRLYVNELKVRGLKSFSGSAALASVNAEFADFLSLDASVDYSDGNFRTMANDSALPTNSRVSGDVGTTWKLDKFLPADWGVNVPLNMRVGSSIDRPQIKPGSDVPLTGEDGEPDKLRDFFTEAKTPSERYQTRQNSRSVSTSYTKSAHSKNPVVNLTAERVSVHDLSYRHNATKTLQGEKPDGSGEEYADLTRTDDYGGALKYDLSPRRPPKWTKWRPLEETKAEWLPSRYKNYELTYLPSTLTFDVADIRYNVRETKRERLNQPADTLRRFDIRHGMNFSYAPISPLLDFDYSLTTSRNLDDEVQQYRGIGRRFVFDYVTSLDPVWGKYAYLYGEQNRSQTANVRFDPTFFEWLKHTFTYNANFTSRLANELEHELDMSVNTKFAIAGSFEFRNIFSSISDAFSEVERTKNSFDAIVAGLDKVNFRSFRFDYSADADLQNNNMNPQLLAHGGAWGVDRLDFLGYQLGVEEKKFSDVISGDMDDDEALGGMFYRKNNGDETFRYNRDSRRVEQAFSTSTSFRIPEPVDINFTTISLHHKKDFRVTPDTTELETTVTFPEIRANATTNIFNTVPVIKENLNGFSLSSSYTYTYSLVKKVNTGVDTTISHAFTPLVRVNSGFKQWPVTFNYGHDFSKSINRPYTNNTKTETNNSDNFEITYTIQKTAKRKEFKLLRWTIPLQGKLDATLDVAHSHTKSESESSAESGAETAQEGTVTQEQRNVNVQPRMTYGFTDKITGGAAYEYNWVKTEDQRTTNTQTFSLTVRISF
ncbi:MAG: cell surface protein SprA [Chitinivibrionales bacterium]|nr:cell surface protein SprA [Chitinivibrionales bacterium]